MPEDLQELFSEIELACPLVYEPHFGYVPQITEIDMPLREPLRSYREFYNFGRAYHDTPPFYLYPPEELPRCNYAPNLLYFSGPPAALTDAHILCEGSLFLSPETKEESPRSLYKHIRRTLTKRFIKSGYCFLSPAVYTDRQNHLFIQRDHRFLAPAWRFDSKDQHVPADIDSWYQTQGKQRGQYESPAPLFTYFSTTEDVHKILLELEKTYRLKFVEVFSNGFRLHHETVFDTADFLIDGDTEHNGPREVYVYEQDHRMVLYLRISGLRDGSMSVVNKAYGTKSSFGDKLYSDFVAKVMSSFQTISEPHYGPLYVSPFLYACRQHIILSLDDPYFRIDENGTASHIWRKELEELMKQWKVP